MIKCFTGTKWYIKKKRGECICICRDLFYIHIIYSFLHRGVMFLVISTLMKERRMQPSNMSCCLHPRKGGKKKEKEERDRCCDPAPNQTKLNRIVNRSITSGWRWRWRWRRYILHISERQWDLVLWKGGFPEEKHAKMPCRRAGRRGEEKRTTSQ